MTRRIGLLNSHLGPSKDVMLRCAESPRVTMPRGRSQLECVETLLQGLGAQMVDSNKPRYQLKGRYVD